MHGNVNTSGGRDTPIYWLYRYVLLERYGFRAIWSGIGSSNHRKLVKYRVPSNEITHKRLKSRTYGAFLVTKFAKIGVVKGRIFTNPVAHPHPNCMRVPPPPEHFNCRHKSSTPKKSPSF